MTLKKMILYLITVTLSFFAITMGMQSTMAEGYDLGIDVILAFVFIFEVVLLIMVIIKSGKVKKYYDPQHLKFAQKLLGAAETVYVVILLNILISFPRVFAFFRNAANEPLRALINALLFPWLYTYFTTHGVGKMACAWILTWIVAMTVLMFFAISKFNQAKKIAIFLENRPKKKQGNVFQTETDTEDTAIPEKQTELFEVFEETDSATMEEAETASMEAVDLIPDEEEFKKHLHQISDLNAADDSLNDKGQRECPFCGSINNREDKQCSFCGVELEQ